MYLFILLFKKKFYVNTNFLLDMLVEIQENENFCVI